jgi:hypothetical protein
MLINMQLSASLARARLSLNLKWRPREENVEADKLTNEEFDGFDAASRVDIKWGEFDMSLVGALWETKVQFDMARQSTKLDDAAPVASKKRKHEKTPW